MHRAYVTIPHQALRDALGLSDDLEIVCIDQSLDDHRHDRFTIILRSDRMAATPLQPLDGQSIPRYPGCFLRLWDGHVQWVDALMPTEVAADE